MRRAANDDWVGAQLIVAPHARGGRLWTAIKAEAQDWIGVTLRAMYADLLLQPFP
jgi:hypothetical protein